MTYLLLCLSFALIGADQEFERVTCGRPGHPCQATQGTVQVSATSTFRAQCTLNQQGRLFRNAPVEPYVAVDPQNPRHLVGAWQQDRWSNGGAAGILTAVSTDGGQSWSRSSAAFSTCTGGTIARASDPWVTIAPDGTVYQAALGLTAESASSTTSVMVSKSSDGGRSWSVPTVLQQDGAGAANDKEMIAADPTDPRFVYVTWDRASAAAQNSALWFSRTTDSGKTWEPSRAIYDPSATGYISCSQIVVLSDGTVVETFDWNAPGTTTYQIASISSHDRGVTWSSPVLVAPDQSIVVVDVKTNGQVRGASCPYSAVDRRSGAIYLAWTDAGFSGNVTDGIVLSKSTDGGNTWSKPSLVNRVPAVQAFMPVVAVSPEGAVAITYYDFRKDTPDPAVLLTNLWKIVSHDGGETWTETAVTDTFDLMQAPLLTGNQPMVGDYIGLAPIGNGFLSFFVTTNSSEGITDIFATSAGWIRRPTATSRLS